MSDWLDWTTGSAAEIAAALRQDWRERGALTADEAFGQIDPKPEVRANKGVARARSGGAMLPFASSPTMRHFKTAGLVSGVKVRNVSRDGVPAQGMARLWSIQDALKGDLAIAVSDFADLPLRQVARLLKEAPLLFEVSKDETAGLVHGYADVWAHHAFVTLAEEVNDKATREKAAAYFAENNEVGMQADRRFDPKLLIVDRRWLFGVNLAAKRPSDQQPMEKIDLKPFPLAEIIALTASDYKVKFFVEEAEHLFADQAADFLRAEAPSVAPLCEHAAVSIELNLFEPMRRFIHRNRKRTNGS